MCEVTEMREEDIRALDRAVMDILLKDRTTGKNIIWATDDYRFWGDGFQAEDEITIMHITGQYSEFIKPRISKAQESQFNRTRDMAEVFTPAWICNAQNNLVDESWFGRKEVFNVQKGTDWKTTEGLIVFPSEKKKDWKHYVDARRMEIACGEGPYLVSRYDSANGLFIEIQVRTKYQHMWATAVETIDEVDSDKIKIGRGTKANRQFLLIASRLLQLYEENGYDIDKVRQSDYADQMRSFEKENHTLAHLRAIKATEVVYSDFAGTVDTGYFIMISQNAVGKTKVFYYPHNNIDKATEFYDTFESRKHKDEDIVLVSTSSVDSLRKAYPNYFSDIGDFLKLMQDFIVT